MISMNRLNKDKRAQIIRALVEGNSLRSTSRMCDVSVNTVTKLLVDVGIACAEYQHKALKDLPCKRIQCDEICSFCYAKEKNPSSYLKTIIREILYVDIHRGAEGGNGGYPLPFKPLF